MYLARDPKPANAFFITALYTGGITPDMKRQRLTQTEKELTTDSTATYFPSAATPQPKNMEQGTETTED